MSVNTLTKSGLSQILKKDEAELVSEWVQEQSTVHSHRGQRTSEADLRKQCGEFISSLRKAIEQQSGDNIESPGWSGMREMLEHLSRSRSAQGYSPSETASFIFSLKKPLFTLLAPRAQRRRSGPGRRDLVDQRAARQARPVHDRGLPEDSRRNHQPPASRRCSSSRRRS